MWEIVEVLAGIVMEFAMYGGASIIVLAVILVLYVLFGEVSSSVKHNHRNKKK